MKVAYLFVVLLSLLPITAAQGPLDLLPFPPTAPAGEQQTSEDSEDVGSALPDLAGQLMEPQEVSANSAATVSLRIGNGGGNASASSARVVLNTTMDQITIRTIAVPALGRHEQFEYNFTWQSPRGMTRLDLVIDATDLVAEFDETNNQAVTWINRAYGGPVHVDNPFRFETSSGSVAEAPTREHRWQNQTFVLTMRPRGNDSIQALVHRDWLDSRMASTSLDSTYTLVSRNNETYYAFDVPAGTDTTYTFEAFRPHQGRNQFSRGATQTFLLDDRPMTARLVSAPATIARTRSVETPNGTIQVPIPADAVPLGISLEAASHDGQGIWIRKAWLAEYGLTRVSFQHEDGTPVHATETENYYHLMPTHFSIINAFADNQEDYVLVSDGASSSVAYQGLYHGLGIVSQRTDSVDETMLRDFIPHQMYTVSAKVGVVSQGNWQIAHPLVLGNRAERTSPAAGDTNHFKAMGFQYQAQDCNQYQAPQVVAYYRGTSGASTTLWTQSGPGYGCGATQTGWTFTLRMRVGSSTTHFEFLDSNLAVLKSTAVSNAVLPMSHLDAITLGSEDFGNYGYESPTEIWVKDITVQDIVGNFVNDEFSSSSAWTFSGSAVRYNDACCGGGWVRLNPDAVAQVGRITLNTPLTTSRFSAEFRYGIGPDASSADGMVFMFYKNLAYTPASGGGLGFIDASEPSNAGHQGYGLALDGWQNTEYSDPSADYVGIIQDHVNTHRGAPSNGNQKSNGFWHIINIDVFETKVVVYSNGSYLFTWNAGGQLSRTYSGIGFASSTGTTFGHHDLDYLKISVPSGGGGGNSPPPPPTQVSPSSGLTGVAANPTLQWNAVTDPNLDAVDYVIDFGTTNPPPGFSNTASTTLPVTTNPGTTYWWRVAARDTYGQQSTPQIPWSFTTAAAGGGGPLTIRDDDGELDAVLYMDTTDDTAVKRLVLPANALASATSATLRVYGKASDCTTEVAYHLFANSVTTLNFKACDYWTGSYTWASFNIPLSQLLTNPTTPRTNSFSITDTSTWQNHNAQLGIDQDRDNGNSDVISSYVDLPGELMWYLEIAGGSGGANVAPTACINNPPSINGRTVTATSCSSDPNGDPLTLTWFWGDGTSSLGANPSPHTYACPGGTYQITLNADDGRAGTNSAQRTVSANEPDSDGDGLKNCQETGTYMTSPTMWDSDYDGLGDGTELAYWNTISGSAWNTNWDRFVSTSNNLLKLDADADGIKDTDEFLPPGNIFGNAAGSCSNVGGRNECPAPNVRDLYVQLNWMVQPDANCFVGFCVNPGHSDKPAAADLNDIRANFANHNAASATKDQVRLHLYEGRYGDGAGSVKLDGTPLPHTNQIYFDRTATTGGASDDLYDYKAMAFPTASPNSRLGYFHFLFFGHEIKDAQGTVAGGMGEVFGNDAAISRNRMPTNTDVVGGVMHEVGHNLIGEYHSLTCYNGFPPGHAGHGYYHNSEAAGVLNLTNEGRLGNFDEGRNSDGACGDLYKDNIDDVWAHSGRSDDAMGFNYVNRATNWSNAGWNALRLDKAVVLGAGNGFADSAPASSPEQQSPELLWFLDALRDGTGALHADPLPSVYHDHEH